MSDLARMGVNCVRFHGLDSKWGRSAIDQSREDTQHWDEEKDNFLQVVPKEMLNKLEVPVVLDRAVPAE